MSANSHVKVFASIRQEAFVNYQSDIKANLFGATTLLGYGLLKRSREILRSSTPRNLPRILQAMPEWHSVQSRLTSRGYDDAVLWLDELKCKPW